MADANSRSGTNYLSPAIQTFLNGLYSRHDMALENALEEMRRAKMPAIQIQPTEGKILFLLLRMIRARKVVEFGTLSGYSGLWMLKALGPNGNLWTCEMEARHAQVARGVFKRAKMASRVSLLEGPALQSLPALSRHAPFDAVFLDADKQNYFNYAKWAFANLRPGGLIIADNAYLFGYLRGPKPNAEWNKTAITNMQKFHKFLAKKCVAVCLPTPDGLAVGLKP